jgi:hypothetical protein
MQNQHVNQHMKCHNDCFLANKLSLSLNTTCCAVLDFKDGCDCTTELQGICLRRVSSCRNFGVIIDDKLKWTQLTDFVYNKLLKSIGIF